MTTFHRRTEMLPFVGDNYPDLLIECGRLRTCRSIRWPEPSRHLKCSSVCFELRSEVTKVEDDSFLRRVTIVNGTTGENRDVDICGLFVMIGADPCTV